MNALLTFNQWEAGFSKTLVGPVDATIPVGARVGILGPNGAGKSVFLKTLAGLMPAIRGSCVWKQDLRFSLVPQESQVNLLFPLRVRDILKMGFSGLSRWRDVFGNYEKRERELLRDIELPDAAELLFRELSGGERQRVLIARALMSHPDVLFLDEPLSYLDLNFQKKIRELLKKWRDEFHFSFFIVEHQLNFILQELDWVFLLGGKKTLVGPVADVVNERTLAEAYGAEVHYHREGHENEIHFL